MACQGCMRRREKIKAATKKLLGSGVIGSAPVSNTGSFGSSPNSPAIYVDADTGNVVDEDWWPTIQPVGHKTPTHGE